MYQLDKRFGEFTAIIRSSDSATIPLSSGNRDCVQFLTDWQGGAEVLDADGAPLAYSTQNRAALGLEAP